MDKKSNLYCVWADKGLALHNSGRTLLCCHSRTYLKDNNGNDIYLNKNTLGDAWQSQTRKQIQINLENGIRDQNCNACWDEEDAGRESRRTVNNRLYNNYTSATTSDTPKLLDLKLGNTCNLSCRHCWPEVSSKWVKDFYEIAVRPTGQSYKEYLTRWDSIQQSYDRENHQLWDQLKIYIQGADYIDVYGAEPMLLNRLWEILNYSVEQEYSTNQTIHINTNGTIWNESYIKLLEKFKKVTIDLSIDGVDQQFDYIRNGETWETMERNLKLYRNWASNNDNIEVNVCVTLFALNVWYLPEIFDFFQQQHINTFFNFLHMPEYLNVKVFPVEIKHQIIEKIKNVEFSDYWKTQQANITNFISSEFENQPELWGKFCKTTNQLDNLRRQNFKETFPEFYTILEPHFKLG